MQERLIRPTRPSGHHAPARLLVHEALGHLKRGVQVRARVRDAQDPLVVLEAGDEVRQVLRPRCTQSGGEGLEAAAAARTAAGARYDGMPIAAVLLRAR